MTLCEINWPKFQSNAFLVVLAILQIFSYYLFDKVNFITLIMHSVTSDALNTFQNTWRNFRHISFLKTTMQTTLVLHISKGVVLIFHDEPSLIMLAINHLSRIHACSRKFQFTRLTRHAASLRFFGVASSRCSRSRKVPVSERRITQDVWSVELRVRRCLK